MRHPAVLNPAPQSPQPAAPTPTRLRSIRTVSQASSTSTEDEEEVWNSLNSDALKTLPRKFQDYLREMQAERYQKRDQVLPANNPVNNPVNIPGNDPVMRATSPEDPDLIEDIGVDDPRFATRDDPAMKGFYETNDYFEMLAAKDREKRDVQNPIPLWARVAGLNSSPTLGTHETLSAVNPESDENFTGTIKDLPGCKNNNCINGDILSARRGKPEGLLGLCYWNANNSRKCPHLDPLNKKSVHAAGEKVGEDKYKKIVEAADGKVDEDKDAKGGNGNATRNSDIVPVTHWKTVARLNGIPTSPDQSSFDSSEKLTGKNRKKKGKSPAGSKRSKGSFRSIRDGIRHPVEMVKKGAAALGGVFHRKEKHPHGELYDCSTYNQIEKPAKPTKIPGPVGASSTKRSPGAAKKGMTFRGKVENYK